MNTSRFLLCITFLLAAVTTVAQTLEPFAGQWEGQIQIPGSPLAVQVQFTPDGEALAGTIDIPAQGAVGLPLGGIEVEGENIRFAIAGIPGDPTFEGSLEDERMQGSFTQAGQSFPFTLTRVGDVMGDEASLGIGEATYREPEGRFTVPAPAGWAQWQEAHTETIRRYFLEEPQGEIIAAVLEAGDERAAVLQVLQDFVDDGLDAGFVTRPVQTGPVNLPSGTWTQRIYLLVSGEILAVVTRERQGLVYLLMARGSQEAFTQAINAATNQMMLGFTLPPAEVEAEAARDLIHHFFTADTLEAERFSDSFLGAVPLAQLEAVRGSIAVQLGAFQEVQGTANPFTLVFERGTAEATVVLDEAGRVTGFFIGHPQANLSVEEVLAELQTLPGEVSLLILQDEEALVALNADTALAVGSTFKLAVLAALLEGIEAGNYDWGDAFALQAEWKSLPTGVLQDAPEGTELSLERLATLMISISDNTATDALIHIIGRENVEAYAEGNRPFLTTHEAFVLKNPEHDDLLERYRAGDEAERRAVLEEAAERSLPGADLFMAGPVAPDVEWFFSTRELCELMKGVQHLPLMSLNPGLADPEAWAHVAYKGGSEPGVLNLTTWLEADDGVSYCVSLTQNRADAVLDEASLFSFYGALLRALRAAPASPLG